MAELLMDAVLASPKCHYRTFGEFNRDRIFYVIWRRDMVGFFSNFAHVLMHLQIAEELGLTPVVDFHHFPTLYNEASPVENNRNAWEYFFLPVSRFSLEDVYASKHVLFCDGLYPPSKRQSLTRAPGADLTLDKYIKIKHFIELEVDRFLAPFASQKLLGVHWRGPEYKTARGHPFPPTKQQILSSLDALLGSKRFDFIFLATDEESYVDLIQREFGKKLIFTKAFRTRNASPYGFKMRESHHYLLAKEVLIDMLVLSRCNGLLSGNSNVSEAAKLFNRGKYEFCREIWNGMNSTNPLLCKFTYSFKSSLPPFLGGFRRELSDL